MSKEESTKNGAMRGKIPASGGGAIPLEKREGEKRLSTASLKGMGK